MVDEWRLIQAVRQGEDTALVAIDIDWAEVPYEKEPQGSRKVALSGCGCALPRPARSNDGLHSESKDPLLREIEHRL